MNGTTLRVECRKFLKRYRNGMMSDMKILIATGVYPPEDGGPATYSKLLKDELLGRKIAVEVLPFRTVRHLPKVVRHVAYLSSEKTIRSLFASFVCFKKMLHREPTVLSCRAFILKR